MRVTLFLACFLSLCFRPAHGQTPASPSAGVSEEPIEPPRPLDLPEAAYPEQASRDGIGGKVGLDLVIDETGAVAEAVVVSPVGHGLDEAAQAAALRYRFEPARQGGQPIAVRVRFTVGFVGPASRPASAPASEPASLPASTPIPGALPEQPPAGPDADIVVLGKTAA